MEIFLPILTPIAVKEIRKKIARQLYDFIKRNPDEKELHIVCHSLGTIILWDVLFCDRLKEEKETLAIRKMLRGTGQDLSPYQVHLKSIITMGSPILFVNAMLDVRSEDIQTFLRRYANTNPLIWTNIIHAADIIAYPLQTSTGWRK